MSTLFSDDVLDILDTTVRAPQCLGRWWDEAIELSVFSMNCEIHGQVGSPKDYEWLIFCQHIMRLDSGGLSVGEALDLMSLMRKAANSSRGNARAARLNGMASQFACMVLTRLPFDQVIC